MRRTADSIEESKSLKDGSEHSPKQPKRNPAAHLVDWQWKKGVSGNPGGRVKNDFAAEFARKVLEAQGDESKLTEYANGFSSQLSKGNAYTFKELAERGYGKLKETKEVTHVYQEAADADLQQRIDSILADLGIAAQIDASGRTEGTQAGAGKTKGHAKDTPVLS